MDQFRNLGRQICQYISPFLSFKPTNKVSFIKVLFIHFILLSPPTAITDQVQHYRLTNTTLNSDFANHKKNLGWDSSILGMLKYTSNINDIESKTN